MAKILSSYISSIRETQESGAAGFISKMKIGDSLYKIKDPSVDDLAAYIESHYKVLDVTASNATANTYISSISLSSDGKVTATRGTLPTIPYVPTHATFTKAANTYIAEVKKDANGNITFTSGTFPVTGVTTSAATANTYVSGISLSNGKVTATRGTLPSVSVTTDDLTTIFDQAYVTIAKDSSGTHAITAYTGFLATTGIKSKTAVGDAALNSTLDTILSKIIGTANDAETAQSIVGAKKHADNLIDTLSNTGYLHEALEAIQQIKRELETGEGANLDTLLDHLKDVTDASGDPMDVGAYVTSKITEANANVVTADATLTSNKIVLGAGNKKVATTSNYGISSSESLTPSQTTTVPTASAVATYVANKITGLDATVRGNLSTSDVLTSGHAIGVKVVEADGKLTSVTVTENFKANGMSYVSYADEQIEFALSYMVVKK